MNVLGGNLQSQGNQNQEMTHAESPPIQHRGTEVSLSIFTRHNPPVFNGSDASEDPQKFVDDVVWICKALGCFFTWMVELAAF